MKWNLKVHHHRNGKKLLDICAFISQYAKDKTNNIESFKKQDDNILSGNIIIYSSKSKNDYISNNELNLIIKYTHPRTYK